MNRHCSRSGCAQTATSTLTYQYGRAMVWLDDLTPERDPHGYDLCERHSTRLSVPNGWRLEDRRDRRVLSFVVATRRDAVTIRLTLSRLPADAVTTAG